MIVLVYLFCELFHQGDHVAVIYLVSQVVQLQLEDRPRVAVLRELGVVLAEAGLVLGLRLLVVDLDHSFLLLHLALEVGLQGGERAAGLRGLHGGEVLGDGAVQLGDHVLILHQNFLELVAGIVVKLNEKRKTILVKSINFIPLSSSSLKKLKSCLIFSRCGALAVRAG